MSPSILVFLVAGVAAGSGPLPTARFEPLLVGPAVPLDLPPPPPPGTELEDHEAMEGVADSMTSAHFAIKWGAEWEPEDVWIERALEDLEETYALQVVDLGFEEPDGMSVARFNVYVADTGIIGPGGTPLDVGVPSGGMGLDDDGWPFVGVSALNWDMDAEWAANGWSAEGEVIEVYMVHEFHHATQYAAGLFYDHFGGSWWFLEGLATWSETRQVPGSAMTWWWFPAVYYLPEVPFQAPYEFWPDDASEEEALFCSGHAYALFVLPLYLSDELATDDLVVQWVNDDRTHVDFMEGLEAVLSERGDDLGAVVTAVWGAIQSRRQGDPEALAWAEANVGPPPGLDHNPTLTLEVGADAVAPPDEWRPGRFGANVLRVEAPEDDLVFSIEPDAAGSAGTPVRWGAAAVLCTDDLCADEVLAVDATGRAEWTVAAAGEDLVDLVLVPLTDEYVEDEAFGYLASADVAPPPDDEEPGGCGCRTSRRPAGSALPLALLLLAARRRSS